MIWMISYEESRAIDMAANNKGYFLQYVHAKDFIKEVKKSVSSFNPADFQYILKVAYPIVIVEVEAYERTKEDFPLVEKTVLRMFRNRIIRSEDIAHLLGLQESYVKKVIRLLASYQQIDENGITQLGLESLEQNYSIKTNFTKQRIQVDGVTGAPIGIREFIDEDKLSAAEDSFFDIPHVEPQESIEISRLVDAVKSDYMSYVNKGDHSLHTNVDEIGNVKFVEVKYTQAFYLENHDGNVIIMCNAHDTTLRRQRDSYRWRVVSTDSPIIARAYGFTVPEQNTSIFEIEKVALLKSQLRTMREEIRDDTRDYVEKLYGFDWSKTDLTSDDNPVLTVSYLSFAKYGGYVFRCLESLARDGCDYIILEKLRGKMIRVTTEDEDLLDLAKRYRKIVKNLGYEKVTKPLESMSSKSDANILDQLQVLLNKLEDPGDEEVESDR